MCWMREESRFFVPFVLVLTSRARERAASLRLGVTWIQFFFEGVNLR